MNNEHILIVEDEKIIAIDLQRRLERFGYEVIGMAGNGVEAVAMAIKLEPDIILMDIMLSGAIDGVDAAHQIKETLDIPIIFLTAYSDEKTLERAKEVEPYGYILKPFKERELYTTIDIGLYKYKMNKMLTRQERLFSAILKSINEGIITLDMEQKITFMNQVAEEMLGITSEQAKGKSISQYMMLTDKSWPDEIMEKYGSNSDRATFFSNMSIKNLLGQTLTVDGAITKIYEKESEKAATGFLITLEDITEFRRLSDTLSYQSSHDSLTGLSNREEFSFKLNEIIKSAKQSGKTHSLLIMDIDRFKAINDTCGSLAGDELLRQIAAHIQTNTSRNDLCARIGGDEFAILLMNCSSDDTINVGTRIQQSVQAQRFIWNDTTFPVTLSLGVVPISQETSDIHSVLAAADDACHISKEEGGDKITIFQALETKFRRRRGDMEWIGKLNRAIEENRFILYYQNIEPLVTNTQVKSKLEVLLRLINDDGNIALPSDYIPAAERYNLMPQIDRWVVENSLRAFRILKDDGSELANRIFSINLSGPSLVDQSLVENIMYYLTKYSLSAENFCFEITETAAIQNMTYATRFIDKLHKEGFTFALDDFGSGFSSFGYLRSLPVDYVKIDGSFVKNIDINQVSFTMVESINSMSHVMGLKTIAEFVTNSTIKDKLLGLGVDYGQGYFFSEPKPLLP